METYTIIRDDHTWAVFQEGDPSRFEKPFDRQIALREFDSCVAFWKSKGTRHDWSLLIQIKRKKCGRI